MYSRANTSIVTAQQLLCVCVRVCGMCVCVCVCVCVRSCVSTPLQGSTWNCVGIFYGSQRVAWDFYVRACVRTLLEGFSPFAHFLTYSLQNVWIHPSACATLHACARSHIFWTDSLQTWWNILPVTDSCMDYLILRDVHAPMCAFAHFLTYSQTW
jgi:hypothetical protein